MATQKNVLCFGDSLTWGTDPSTTTRYQREERWPTIMAQRIGGERLHVIEEAMGGRTTSLNDYTFAADRNGVNILPVLLASHQPIDLLIIMLGVNDLKPHLSGSPVAAAAGVKRLVEIARGFPYAPNTPQPEILIVSPPHPVPTEHAFLGPLFSGASDIGHKLSSDLRRIADELDCPFFDAAETAKASPVDGVHLDRAQTRLLGEALAQPVALILGLEIHD